MADVVTFDNRLSTFGDRVVVTGTLVMDASGTTADVALGDFLSEVDAFIINGSGSTVRAAPSSGVDGTTVKLGSLVASAEYVFMAIGKRS